VFSRSWSAVFKGEDDVSAASILETVVLGFQTFIANVRVHLIHDDVGNNCVWAIEEIDRALVVWFGGVPFFEYGVRFSSVHFSGIEAPCQIEAYWFDFMLIIKVVLIYV